MRSAMFLCAVLGLSSITPLSGCETEPKAEDKIDFMVRAREATAQFKRSVPGLDQQIKNSAGYIVFPDVAQWGILFGGGTSGRGALFTPDGTQTGWSALQSASVGLQAGVQGFRMLVIFENKATLEKFMKNELTGSATAVAVADETSSAGRAPFTNGVAIYQGANRGLMAGMNVGLDYMRYKPFNAEAAGK